MTRLEHPDQFYGANRDVPSAKSAFRTKLAMTVLRVSPAMWLTMWSGVVMVFVVTRLMSEKPSRDASHGRGKNVWRLPYWIPFYGHGALM